jgi:hypothetical protein
VRNFTKGIGAAPIPAASAHAQARGFAWDNQGTIFPLVVFPAPNRCAVATLHRWQAIPVETPDTASHYLCIFLL